MVRRGAPTSKTRVRFLPPLPIKENNMSTVEDTIATLHEQHNHIVLTGFCSMGRLVGVAYDWMDCYYIVEKAQGYKTTDTLIEYVTMVTYCESLKNKIDPRFYDYLDTMFRSHSEWRVEYHETTRKK
jgi:hypothetical protein